MTTRDKLADLLARIQKAWEAHSEDGKVSISMRDAMELCEQVLPTVIQQAQPPAASVTNAMVGRALSARVPGGAQVWHWLSDEYGKHPHPTAYTIMRAAIEAALAAQENPNG